VRTGGTEAVCGIFGSYDWGRPADPGELRRMGRELQHRGPDGSGEFTDGGVGLGCRRLGIVDVAGGRQPFLSEDGDVVLVCNGEVFNYRELRAELEPSHRFASNCDAEVIVHLYEDRGIDLVDDLNGQFGFALLDRRRRELFLARDRFGVCPLYFATTAGRLLFASEVKAILPCSGISRRLDLRALDQALCLPAVVSPTTMFADVRSVRPGHYLRITPDGVEDREYWDLVYPTAGDDPWRPDERRLREEIVHRLRLAVRRRLQSDVPIGLYVSGGLDSAMVAALAASESGAPVACALSVGFPQRELDESGFQRLVASRLPCPHVQMEVTMDDVCRLLERVVWHSEAPLRESYNVASLKLSEAARGSGAKVVLTGEGSDELFAGYASYRFESLAESGTPGRSTDGASPGELEAREAMWGDATYGYDLRFAELSRERRRLYSRELAAALPEFDCTTMPVVDGERVRGRHWMHKRSYLDVKLRLTDHLLGDHGDRMTMANSVEGRYPFLDPEFVELAMRVPPSLKLRDHEEKHILKQAARGLVPDRVVEREKFPFTAPSSPYLAKHAARFLDDWLSPDLIARQGLFDGDHVQRLRRAYADPAYRAATPMRTDWLMLVLTCTMLNELVARRFGAGTYVGGEHR
jgi:asparagine synthase (glutamine-hydrolysing)